MNRSSLEYAVSKKPMAEKKRAAVVLLTFSCLAPFLFACGGDDGGTGSETATTNSGSPASTSTDTSSAGGGTTDANATTGSGGTTSNTSAGTSSSGGAQSTSAGAGGETTTGTGTTGTSQGHCGLGDSGFTFDICPEWNAAAAGVEPGPFVAASSASLPAPTVAGEPLPFSLDVSIGVTLEFWGSDGPCGNGVEMIGTSAFPEGIHCIELNPTQAFDHILVVERDQPEPVVFIGPRVCAGGSCP